MSAATTAATLLQAGYSEWTALSSATSGNPGNGESAPAPQAPSAAAAAATATVEAGTETHDSVAISAGARSLLLQRQAAASATTTTAPLTLRLPRSLLASQKTASASGGEMSLTGNFSSGAGSKDLSNYLLLIQMMRKIDPEAARSMQAVMDSLRGLSSSGTGTSASLVSAPAATAAGSSTSASGATAATGTAATASSVLMQAVFQFDVSVTMNATVATASSTQSTVSAEATAESAAAGSGLTVAQEKLAMSLTIEMRQILGFQIASTAQTALCDPLILDLAGDGINLRSAQDGVSFDLTGDGQTERTAFIQGDDALLFLDENGDGILTDGNELFGDQQGDVNGFEKLRRYDDNGDNVIDARDRIFSQLLLFQDANRDGVCSALETMTLETAGVTSIALAYDNPMTDDGKGNRIAQTAAFTRADGSTGLAADALLAYIAQES